MKMAVAEENAGSAKVEENNTFEWNVRYEVQLLLALIGHKPVGVSKYFHMACILEKFSAAVKRHDISSKVIWDRLDTMYDMQALEETELLPFPNNQEEFSLPKAQYGDLVEQKKSGTMPPPPVPSPPPDMRKDDLKERKDVLKESSQKRDAKEVKKPEDKRLSLKDQKKDVKDDAKKDKRLSKDLSDDKKKERDTLKGKEAINKEARSNKRAANLKDDEESSVSSSGSAKKGRDNFDIDEVTPAPKRAAAGSNNAQSSNNNSKGKRQTRLSHGKVSDDSGSNKSVSPLTVSSPPAKRRRQV